MLLQVMAGTGIGSGDRTIQDHNHDILTLTYEIEYYFEYRMQYLVKTYDFAYDVVRDWQKRIRTCHVYICVKFDIVKDKCDILYVSYIVYNIVCLDVRLYHDLVYDLVRYDWQETYYEVRYCMQQSTISYVGILECMYY
jgi:hypothetical protein